MVIINLVIMSKSFHSIGIFELIQNLMMHQIDLLNKNALKNNLNKNNILTVENFRL